MAGIIPLDLFLTPYSDPYGKSAIQGNDLANFGNMLNENSKFDRTLEQRKRESEASNALGNRNASVSEAWHKDQTNARREASSERSQSIEKSAKEKRVSSLIDALRKAKTMQEREMIRQELTRLGWATEEVDTDLPEEMTAAPDLAPGPAPVGTQKPAQAQKAPKPSPGFKSALDTFMQDEARATGDAPADGPPTTFPWELGMPAEPPKKKRGGKYVIRDPEGNLAHSFDEPLERDKSRKAVATALDPYIGSPKNPEEKAAAEKAQKLTQNMLDLGYGMKEATEAGRDQFNKDMGRYKDQKLPSAAGTGGGGGPSRQEQSKQFAMTDDTKDIIFKIDDRAKLPAARDAMGAMSNMDKALDNAHNEGFSGGAAISSYLKAISGAQVSDKEADRIFGGAGKAEQWENELNRYVNGGRLPDGLIQGLKGVASRAREVFKARSEDAAMKAEGMIDALSTMATPEQKASQKKAARGYFTGDFGGGVPGKGAPDDKRKALEDKLKGMNLD